MQFLLKVFLIFLLVLNGIPCPITYASQPHPAPVVLAKNERQPAAIGVDATNVYWIAESRSAIHKVTETGGTVTPLVTGETGIRRLVVVSVNRESVNFVIDDLDIFWSNYNDGTVSRRRK